MINLPQNDYLTIEKDGRTYSCCTLRQKVRHTIGLDDATRRTLYKRNGKTYFKPTTYYFTDEGLDWLEEQLHITIRRQ